MKKETILIDNLRTLECSALITMMEDDYYREMIACKPDEANERIMNLIDETLEVEIVASSPAVERYDLAILCRDYRVSLADRIILSDLI